VPVAGSLWKHHALVTPAIWRGQQKGILRERSWLSQETVDGLIAFVLLTEGDIGRALVTRANETQRRTRPMDRAV